MSLNEHKFLILGAVAASVGLFILVKTKGVADLVEPIAETAGEVAVQVVNGAAAGIVNGISKEIGIPTTSEMITDPAEAQAYRDKYGWWQAMGHMSAATYWGTHS